MVSKEESDRITELLNSDQQDKLPEQDNKEETEQPSAASSSGQAVASVLPEPEDQVEATTLPEVCSEGYLPEGTKITYKGEEVTLRESGFFNLGAKRFRARFTQTAGGLLRIVTEAPGKEIAI